MSTSFYEKNRILLQDIHKLEELLSSENVTLIEYYLKRLYKVNLEFAKMKSSNGLIFVQNEKRPEATSLLGWLAQNYVSISYGSFTGIELDANRLGYLERNSFPGEERSDAVEREYDYLFGDLPEANEVVSDQDRSEEEQNETPENNKNEGFPSEYFQFFKNQHNGSNSLFYPKLNETSDIIINVVNFDNSGRVLGRVDGLLEFPDQREGYFIITETLDHFVFYVCSGCYLLKSMTSEQQVRVLYVTDKSFNIILERKMSYMVSEAIALSANSSKLVCYESGGVLSWYDLKTSDLQRHLIDNIKMSQCGIRMGMEMSENYLFLLFYYNNVKIFDQATFELVGQINESIPPNLHLSIELAAEGIIEKYASQIKLVSSEYLALYYAPERKVNLYNQDGGFGLAGVVDLSGEIERGWTLIKDKTRHISFHDPYFSQIKFFSIK
jgi:hypothetical protein